MSKVKIEKYLGNKSSTLIKLLNTDGFMTTSEDPAESVIASIIEYQNKTNNFRNGKGSIMLNEQTEIVGFLGSLSFPAQYESQLYYCAQTTSAFVDGAYPGNFKKMAHHFIQTNKDIPTFTIFPTPKIFSSFEKMGFVEVNPKRFKSNNYIIQDYLSFTKELYQNRIVLKILSTPLALFANLFLKNKIQKTQFVSQSMNDFNNDYSLIEESYNSRTKDLFAAKWSNTVLNNKFGNKLNRNKSKIKENEVIHICCYNKDQVVGSVVLKKVRNYRRFIISDIQTIEENRRKIIKSLINRCLIELKSFNFNSILFFGIEEIYSDIISKEFKCFKKSVDQRAYYLPFKGIPAEKVSIVFSDDDLNY